MPEAGRSAAALIALFSEEVAAHSFTRKLWQRSSGPSQSVGADMSIERAHLGIGMTDVGLHRLRYPAPARRLTVECRKL